MAERNLFSVFEVTLVRRFLKCEGVLRQGRKKVLEKKRITVCEMQIAQHTLISCKITQLHAMSTARLSPDNDHLNH